MWPIYTVADLERAQRHVDDGLLRLAEQRDRIVWMASRGIETAQSEHFYELMSELLDLMIRHRDEIAANLDDDRSKPSL